MKKLILVLLLLVGYYGWGQVSVFGCNFYTKTLTQAILYSDSNFFNSCFEMGINSSVMLQGDAHKTIKASSQIHLKDSVHLGPFINAGQTHLLISDSTDFDVVAMNYDKLDAVLRYKKLELGIQLPSDIENRISDFINNTGVDSLQLNPFLEWDIDVEASFYNNWGETINGFYTREYQQNSQTHDWDDIGTDYSFRIRFAPPRNGEWNSQVVIKVKGQIVYKSNFFFFNVIESGDPGYVHVHENNANLKRGERMIFPIGQNFPSPSENCISWGGCYDFIPINSEKTQFINPKTKDTVYYGHNLFASDSTEKAANTIAWNNYLEMLEQYLKVEDGGGSKYFRTIQTPYSSLIEFENKGDYYKRLHYAAETDKILDLCEQYDALFQFNLMVQEPMMKYANYDMSDWDWDYYMMNGTLPDHDSLDYLYNKPVYCYNDDPSNRNGGVLYTGTKKPYEMFTNESDLAYHKQRIRYYIARYGYSTKIYEFELLSEPWHINENWTKDQSNQGEEAPFLDENHPEHNLARKAIYTYHKVISEYIKDSLQHWRQLIGIDMAWGLGDEEGGLDKSIELASIDIVGFNPYYVLPNALISSNTNYIHKYVKKIWDLRKSNIPVIIPEGGTDESYAKCSNYATLLIDKMALPFIGIAGYNSWPGYTPFKFTHENDVVTMPNNVYKMWENTIRVKNHMNGNEVINTLSQGGGYWKHDKQKAENYGLIKRYAIEHQYYNSLDKSFSVGYVYNRTYNVKTRGIVESDCFNEEFGALNNSPRNIEWNEVKNIERLRVNNLKAHTKYKIDWYSAFHESNNGPLKSDCMQTDNVIWNWNWGITLEYPVLTATHNGSNDLPAVWYVIYQEDCNVNKALQNDSSSIILSEVELKLNIHPNPFRDQLSIQSPRKDQMVLKSLEGKIIGTYNIVQGETNINTSHLNNGIFIITFIIQNKTLKIIKQ